MNFEKSTIITLHFSFITSKFEYFLEGKISLIMSSMKYLNFKLLYYKIMYKK